MSELDRDVEAFIAHDALAHRLRVRRRPQDAGAPECSPRELRTLSELGRRGRLTLSELAVLLDVPLSTTTRTVERLVEKGLVERKQSAIDRRIVEVRFGRRGKRINQFVLDSRAATAQAMLKPLSARQREALVKQLARIVDVLSESGARR